MTDRTAAPVRARRRLRIAAASGGWALVLALGAAACSGSHADTDNAGGLKSPPASPVVGAVDSNPSDTPQIQPSLHPGKPAPTDYRALPSTRKLTVAWDWGSWLNHAKSVGGAGATANNWQDPVESNTAWRWSGKDVGRFEVGVQTQLPNGMAQPSCSAENFEPASAAAASQITDVLLLCVDTGLSGTSTADAEAWLKTQITPELKEINGLTDGEQAVSATPTFGSATYFLSTRYTPGYGYVITLQVW